MVEPHRTRGPSDPKPALDEGDDLDWVDQLTQLYNRAYVEARIGHLQAMSRRSGVHLGALLIEVDHFNRLAATYGATAGDAVLVELARRVRHGQRPEDVTARWGPQELLILTTFIDRAGPAAMAERLRRHIAHRPFEVRQGAPVMLTVSIGAAIDQEEGELLAEASRALRAALAAGRDAVRMWRRGRAVVEPLMPLVHTSSSADRRRSRLDHVSMA